MPREGGTVGRGARTSAGTSPLWHALPEEEEERQRGHAWLSDDAHVQPLKVKDKLLSVFYFSRLF